MNPAYRLVVPALRLPIESEDPWLELAARGVGGFCVFGGDQNVAGLLARLQDAAPYPLLMTADHEDGVGQHVAGFSIHPPAAALGPDDAELAGIRTAVEARRLGFNMVFAPVCDVVSEPWNPIIQARAFRDPLNSAPRYIAGARRFGLRTCAKHFPGHGATTSDSHSGMPIVTAPAEVWRERDLPPFAAAIAAGVDAVMTAHIACPGLSGEADVPATISKRIMTGLLRDEMGFEGLLLTDALLMEGVRSGRGEGAAATLSLAAGCDVLLCPGDVEAVLEAAAAADDIDASLRRVAAAAELLPDPLDAAAERSVTIRGEPLGAGAHPLRIYAVGDEGAALGRASGVAYEIRDFEGKLGGRGGEGGLSRPVVAILRPERAWGGPLTLPKSVQQASESADAVMLFGAPVLLEGSKANWVLHAPGSDRRTLQAAVRKSIHR
ncbi:MAG: glycoside hydrolase family 3 N-terminal domain-containing protein [Planctomycetota bacterium]|jgi:beta-glucosidase-like glycosyl hydrolase